MYELTLTQAYFPAQSDQAVFQTTVGSCLRDGAARWPESEAMVEVLMDGTSGRRWTFEQLLNDSERLAQALSARFKKGEKVCVWAPNSPEWVMIEYACGLAGLVLVTANPAYQASELRYVLEQSQAVALFMVPEYRGNPMEEIAEQAVKGNGSLREIVDLRDANAMLAQADDTGLLPKVTPDDPAQIQYTSGTTGFPKGAVLHHRGLTNNARFYALRKNARASSVWTNFMPLFHTASCGLCVLGCVQSGATMLIIPIFDAERIVPLIEREGVTGFDGVPTMLLALVETQKRLQVDVSRFENASSGGALVAADLVRSVTQNFGCDFETVYGQTESSPLISMHYHDDTIDDICSSVGQPLPQTEVSIRSMENNTIMPIEANGEICVRGYNIMHGYNNNPDATAAAIDEDGWLHTGDLGTMDSRGYLRVTGRVKEMIIRGGENLFPAEIENTMLDHEDVLEVAVVGLPDEKWGEVVACFFRAESMVDTKVLRAHCREHMAPQKTPSVWVQVEAYPLTGSGKIRKFKLAEDFIARKYTALES